MLCGSADVAQLDLPDENPAHNLGEAWDTHNTTARARHNTVPGAGRTRVRQQGLPRLNPDAILYHQPGGIGLAIEQEIRAPIATRIVQHGQWHQGR